MREMGRSVFCCVCVSLCAVTQITEINHLVLCVQVIKTKNFFSVRVLKRKGREMLLFSRLLSFTFGLYCKHLCTITCDG